MSRYACTCGHQGDAPCRHFPGGQAHIDVSVESFLSMLAMGDHKYRVVDNAVPEYAHVDDVTYLPERGIIRLHFDCKVPGDPVMRRLP